MASPTRHEPSVIKNAIVLALLRMRMSAEEIVTNQCAGKKHAA
jgi:hypothetical protein